MGHARIRGSRGWVTARGHPVWGRYTTAGAISGYRGLLPAAMKRGGAYLKDILYAVPTFRGVDRYEGRRGERICAVSLGWFIAATK